MTPMKFITIPALMATALGAMVAAQPAQAQGTPTPKQLMEMIQARQK